MSATRGRNALVGAIVVALLAPVIAGAQTPTPTPSPATTCPASLQAAIDNTPAGGTLDITGCFYAPSDQFIIRKPITLVGGRIDAGYRAFSIKASDVTIRGTEIWSANAPLQDGAIATGRRDAPDWDYWTVDRLTLDRVHVHESAGSCIAIDGGSGHRIVDSEFARCSQQGFSLSGVTDTVFARNRVHHNNTAGYDPGWEAGGGKASRVLRLTFEANDSWANDGPGLWCDVDCRDVTFRDNRVWDNSRPGIFFETSTGATITGNRAWGNGFGWPAWGWGGGIVVSSSGRANVTNNVVAWNADGIVVISQNRSDSAPVVGNRVADNTIVLAPRAGDSSDKTALGWLQDWAGSMFAAASDNRGSGNDYWVSTPEPQWARFAWNGPVETLAAFNGTPGEEGGRYMSSAEKDKVLAAAGIPTAP